MYINTAKFFILGIHPFNFFSMSGMIVSFTCFVILTRRTGHDIIINCANLLISLIGLFIGAKIFGVITNLLVSWNQDERIDQFLFKYVGIVFYGGLLGFLAVFILINKIQNKSVNYEIIDIIAVCIPLFHFFARIGCFLTGCCYGKEINTPISVVYKPSHLDPVLRLPVQLIESGANMIIFIICIIILIKHKLPEKILPLYLSMYAIVRFIDEFFRGDIERGFIGVFSFSQVISLIILSCLAFHVYKRKGLYHE